MEVNQQFSVLKMDDDQVQAYHLIIGGHNLCLTGQALTGKSYVVTKAVKEIRRSGMHVALICSTCIGMSF